MKNETKKLVLSKMRQKKQQTVLQCAAIALATALIYVVVSLCVPIIGYYAAQVKSLGEDPLKTAGKGAMNYLSFAQYLILKAGDEDAAEENSLFKNSTGAKNFKYFGKTLEHTDSDNKAPETPEFDTLFSPSALVANLPASLAFVFLLCLLTARSSLSLAFSFYEKEQRRFFASIMLAGADLRFVKRTALTESLYLSLAGIPSGLIAGTAEIFILRAAAVFVFRRHGSASPPIAVRPSLIGAFFAAVFAFLLVLRCARKSYKKLSIRKDAFTQSSAFHVNIGNRVFSAKEKAYRRHGIEHYVATRNVSNQIDKYLKIFFITAVFINSCILPPIYFAVSKNYNTSLSPQIRIWLADYSLCVETVFYMISFVTAITGATSMYSALSANISANTGEYILMHSIGASMRAIRRTVRKEGIICVAVSIIVSLFPAFHMIYTLFNEYGEKQIVSLNGAGAALIGLGALIAVCCLSSSLGVYRANRRLGKTDTIRALKDFSY